MTEQINPGSINITPANASAASALIGDPSKFGRVAEDGTVYVRTSDGEKAVGSYPGKTAEEAQNKKINIDKSNKKIQN
jgi:hypothetical protein